ncbi:hypothetical protein [Pseudonocardia sp. KRD291]|uniref:hypothetical protein n=1 Tax=Pseudonocardia sp. KRD291 TaxID=2792007 RepID=UPI001C4A586A|nr:hypothetical protein [Pseudonocardia sp. KRD291]MBW0101370.1 hypothetical protein [Pseudonocardia sp. KRD291]
MSGATVLVVALLATGQGLWLGVNAVLGLPDAGWPALALSNVVAFAPPAVAPAVWLRLRTAHGVADLGFRVRRPALGVVAGVATAVALGLLLAFIALSGGGLWASCAFHTTWNAIPSIASAGSAAEGPLDTGASVANVVYVVVYLVLAAAAGWMFRSRSLHRAVGSG